MLTFCISILNQLACTFTFIYVCQILQYMYYNVCNFDPSWSNSYTTWQNIDMELISLVFTLLNFRSSYVTTVLLFFERGRWSIFFLINHLQELLLHDCIQYVKIARCIDMFLTRFSDMTHFSSNQRSKQKERPLLGEEVWISQWKSWACS